MSIISSGRTREGMNWAIVDAPRVGRWRRLLSWLRHPLHRDKYDGYKRVRLP